MLIYRFSPFYAEPIVAGLDKNNNPFISGMDLLGCATMIHDFCAAGTGEDQLYGVCEALWQPNLVCYLNDRNLSQ